MDDGYNDGRQQQESEHREWIESYADIETKTRGGSTMLWKDTGGGDFENPEPGTYAALSYRVIDLGTQTGEYQGAKTVKRQVIISWELDELMSDGRPFVVSKFYTASLSEKATLRHDLESWRGRAFTEDELAGFDARNVLGAPCMLSLVKNDKGKIKVATVSKLPKNMPAPKPHNPQLLFSLDKFDHAAFDGLSDGIKKIIMQSPEYMAAIGKPAPAKSGIEDMESDVPF